MTAFAAPRGHKFFVKVLRVQLRARETLTVTGNLVTPLAFANSALKDSFVLDLDLDQGFIKKEFKLMMYLPNYVFTAIL